MNICNWYRFVMSPCFIWIFSITRDAIIHSLFPFRLIWISLDEEYEVIRNKGTERPGAQSTYINIYSSSSSSCIALCHTYSRLDQYVLQRSTFSGEYYQFDPGFGYFACRACENPIYSAAAKFHSGCGWPAFDKCYAGEVLIRDIWTTLSSSHIMVIPHYGHPKLSSSQEV